MDGDDADDEFFGSLDLEQLCAQHLQAKEARLPLVPCGRPTSLPRGGGRGQGPGAAPSTCHAVHAPAAPARPEQQEWSSLPRGRGDPSASHAQYGMTANGWVEPQPQQQQQQQVPQLHHPPEDPGPLNPGQPVQARSKVQWFLAHGQWWYVLPGMRAQPCNPALPQPDIPPAPAQYDAPEYDPVQQQQQQLLQQRQLHQPGPAVVPGYPVGLQQQLPQQQGWEEQCQEQQQQYEWEQQQQEQQEQQQWQQLQREQQQQQQQQWEHQQLLLERQQQQQHLQHQQQEPQNHEHQHHEHQHHEHKHLQHEMEPQYQQQHYMQQQWEPQQLQEQEQPQQQGREEQPQQHHQPSHHHHHHQQQQPRGAPCVVPRVLAQAVRDADAQRAQALVRQRPLHQHQHQHQHHQQHQQRQQHQQQRQQPRGAPCVMPQCLADAIREADALRAHAQVRQRPPQQQASWQSDTTRAQAGGSGTSRHSSGGTSGMSGSGGPTAQQYRSSSGTSGGAAPGRENSNAGGNAKGQQSVPGARGGVGPPPPSKPAVTGITYKAMVGLENGTHLFIKVGAHEYVDQALRGIPGISYQQSREPRWLLPLAAYQACKDALDGMDGLHVVWELLPDIVMNIIKAAGTVPNDTSRYSKLQHPGAFGQRSLEERMMEFQREGVHFALRKGGRVLIGDEMGLGKTVQACALLQCYSDEWPALVIVPSSLRGQWADSLKLWLGVDEQDVLVVHTSKDADKLRSARIAIVSYDIMTKLGKVLLDLKIRVVVADEAHYIKTHTSKRCQVALPLLQQAKRAVLLSGTPALSRPAELITLMQAVLPNAKITPKGFAARYCQGNHFSEFAGSKNQEELNRLITACVMIRRRKAEVLPQLPAKRRQLLYLSLRPEDSAKIKQQADALTAVSRLMGSMRGGGGSGLQGLGTEQMQLIGQLYMATAEAKVKAVQQYIQELLAGDEEIKFLVFAHHKCLLDGIDAQCRQSKVKSIRIDGDTDTRVRDDLRKRFQEDPSCRVAVLSIRAAGTGLTLTAASTVLFAEMTWVPGEVLQAEDRVHRIGQTNSVNIHFLMARNSIDDLIWQAIQNKLDNVGQVLDGKQDSLQVASRHVRGYDSTSAGLACGFSGDKGEGALSPAGDAKQQRIQRYFKGPQQGGRSSRRFVLDEDEEEEHPDREEPQDVHAAKRGRH